MRLAWGQVNPVKLPTCFWCTLLTASVESLVLDGRRGLRGHLGDFAVRLPTLSGAPLWALKDPGLP